MPLGETKAAIYFYTYWLMEAVSEALLLWLMIALALRLCHGSEQLKISIVAGILFVAYGIFFLAAPHSGTLLISIEDAPARMILAASRSLSFSWLFTFLAVTVAADFFGLQCSRRLLLVAIGVSLHAMNEVGLSWMLGWFRSFSLISNLHSLVGIGILWVWLGSLVVMEEPLGPLPDIDQIRSIAKIYLHIL